MSTVVDPPVRAQGVSLRVRDAAIRFGDFTAVSGVDLQVEPGEFVCLLGPSGCGKSTLLSALAGFVPLAEGSIHCADEHVTGNNSHAGMVFQSTEVLFDWMTAAENVGYGPRMHGASADARARIADHYLTMVGLGHAQHKYPGELSGGMRQRVQIARVLANEPRLILMDEPFGALDAQTRLVMQEELSGICGRTNSTVVFVTHDIDEAIVLADRIVVMTAGPAAGIKSVYRVDIDRPRERHTPGVTELFDQLHADISVEVERSLAGQGLEERS
ncbi:ABC transporter ATP-binding protein [Raineyella sp.]|uniref:ABC transporter ATP-binding protein n=1 Tax=Raineyella sp. TaxID=1911550 RepID=UPI002B1FB05F|nr:ABC transporter ATP-binding protein [Raineyella sp.]MEA5155307.1 ABC transporter ATP-binding protein [Raineyella sp.]